MKLLRRLRSHTFLSSVLPSLNEEDPAPNDEPTASDRSTPSRLRRASQKFQGVLVRPFSLITRGIDGKSQNEMPQRLLGSLERIACLVNGLVLGSFMVTVVAALIVWMDTFYPVVVVHELARVSRQTFASFLDLLGVV